MIEELQTLHEAARDALARGDKEMADNFKERAIQAEMMIAWQMVYGGQMPILPG